MTLKKKDNKQKKKIKNGPKNSLESPFAQSLPPLDTQLESDVKTLLKSSFTLILKNALIQGKGAQSGVDKSEKYRKELKVSKTAFTSYVTFGFNAVMRGLEQNKIKCVFVKAEAKPDILPRSFLHVCNLKAIPLIPLKGLSKIVKEVVGIKSTLALGLKSTACENGTPFCDLYTKCCSVLSTDQLSSESENPARAKSASKLFKNVPSPSLAHRKQRGAFHLTKESRLERAFRPPKGSIFVYHDPQTLSFDNLNTRNTNIDFSKSSSSKHKKEERSKVAKKGSLDSSDFAFFIDVGEVPDPISQEKPHKDIQIGEDVSSGSLAKHDNKKPRTNEFSYVPTKIRRIKSNPNRRH